MSEKGQGSEFWFEITLEEAQQQMVNATAEVAAQGQLSRKAAILLVEDDPVNQIVAVQMLEQLGVTHVDVVGDGQDALKALEKRSYDLILMDVQMPVMDGLEATRMIRAAEARAREGQSDRPTGDGKSPAGVHVPIVATTAYAMKGDRDRCLEAGMDDYIAKPISWQQLTDVLHEWLQWERVPASAGGAEGAGSSRGVGSGESGRPVWDRTGMMERLSNDDVVAAKLIAAFLEVMPERLVALDTALAAGNAATVAHEVHAIKGAAANVGGEMLREIANEIEQAARADDLGVVRKRQARLVEAFEQLRTVLKMVV